jgi:hypothetical protein
MMCARCQRTVTVRIIACHTTGACPALSCAPASLARLLAALAATATAAASTSTATTASSSPRRWLAARLPRSPSRPRPPPAAATAPAVVCTVFHAASPKFCHQNPRVRCACGLRLTARAFRSTEIMKPGFTYTIAPYGNCAGKCQQMFAWCGPAGGFQYCCGAGCQRAQCPPPSPVPCPVPPMPRPYPKPQYKPHPIVY